MSNLHLRFKKNTTIHSQLNAIISSFGVAYKSSQAITNIITNIKIAHFASLKVARRIVDLPTTLLVPVEPSRHLLEKPKMTKSDEFVQLLQRGGT